MPSLKCNNKIAQAVCSCSKRMWVCTIQGLSSSTLRMAELISGQKMSMTLFWMCLADGLRSWVCFMCWAFDLLAYVPQLRHNWAKWPSTWPAAVESRFQGKGTGPHNHAIAMQSSGSSATCSCCRKLLRDAEIDVHPQG